MCSAEVDEWLLSLVQSLQPSASPVSLLTLDVDVGESTDGLVWIIANTLEFCWGKGSVGKSAGLTDCLATFSSLSDLLADTRHN